MSDQPSGSPGDDHTNPATREALRRTRQDLSQLIPPMPVDLPARLASALAAERACAEPAGDTAPVAAPVVVLHPGRHRESRERRRARIRTGVLAVAAALVVLGGGGVVLSQLSGPGGADSAAGVAAEARDDAGDAGAGYDRTSLRAAVPGLLAEPQVAGPAEGGTPSDPDTSGGSQSGTDAGTTAGALPCLRSVPVALDQALTVLAASYDGVPALILIFPADAGSVQVTVVSDCTDGQTPVVLDQFSASR